MNMKKKESSQRSETDNKQEEMLSARKYVRYDFNDRVSVHL